MEESIRRWLASKQAYIRDNAQTVTPKMLRSLVAEELKLTKEEVDPFKKLIKSIAVEFLTAPVTPVPAVVHASPLVDELEEEDPVGSSDEEGESEEEEVKASSAKKAVRKKKRKSPAAAKKKQKKDAKAGGGGGGGVGATRLITKAKKILKEASIRIPPNIYKKNKTTALLEEALTDFLGKHDLQLSSTRKEIQKVRKRLEIERDMDGIDMSNVLAGGRRPRRGAALANAFDLGPMETQQDTSEEGEEAKHPPIKRNNVIDSESESDM